MTDFTDAPWDGAASNYKDTDAYCAACLIDTNPADSKKTQDNCKLPIKTPSGAVNKNALSSALGALNGARNALTGVSAADKKKAARALQRYYQQAKMDVPDSLRRLAQ